MSLYICLSSVASAILSRRFGTNGLLVAPAAWVSAEYARAHLLGGFPWIPLGNAVVSLLPIAQFASITGVYGLSWFLATLHALIAATALTDGRRRLVFASSAVVLVVCCSLWGAIRLRDNALSRAGSPMRVALVQGNIPQTEKWDPSRASVIFNHYLQMTRDAAAKGVGLVLWPESATPFYFDEEPLSAAQLRNLVANIRTP